MTQEKNISQMDFKVIHLVCVECQKVFAFDVGEQKFFLSKQLSQPRRCPVCRKIRRMTLVPDGGQHD